MTHIFRRVLALFCAALVLLPAAACSKKGEKLLESSSLEKTVVMTIGGFDVPLELYRYVALNYKADYESGASPDIWLGEEGAALLEELNENTEATLVYLCATPTLAEQYGIRADDAYVKDTVQMKMEAVYEEFDNDYAAYDEYLRSHNMNDSVYRFLVRNDILAEELTARMGAAGEIPMDDDTLKKVLGSDEVIRVKQILVSADDGLGEEEMEAKASALLERALAGEDFDDLVQHEGRDLYMFNNPDGYYISRGVYHREFEEAAFSLAVGEIGGPVRTDAGWSVLRRYEKEQAYLDSHFEELAENYIAGQYNLLLEAHEAALADQVVPGEKLSDYTIFNLDSTY